MERDSKAMRGERSFLFCDLKSYKGLDALIEWLEKESFFPLHS